MRKQVDCPVVEIIHIKYQILYSLKNITNLLSTNVMNNVLKVSQEQGKKFCFVHDFVP